MSKIEQAVQWAVNIANDNSHGYSQQNRWGPDYDCSSLVISAFEQAGVPVKTRGATYTGNMRGAFLKCGFKDVTSSVNLSTGAGMQRGDVLLNIVNHTALHIGSGRIVHARSSEGNSVPGDGSGNEIRTQAYWNYPWDCVLRYSEISNNSVKTDTAAEKSVEKVITYTAPTKTMQTALPLLKLGHKGQSVSALQTLLRWHGCTVDVDGYFGNDTLAAVKEYQTANGLTVDGEVGAASWRMLIGR